MPMPTTTLTMRADEAGAASRSSRVWKRPSFAAAFGELLAVMGWNDKAIFCSGAGARAEREEDIRGREVAGLMAKKKKRGKVVRAFVESFGFSLLLLACSSPPPPPPRSTLSLTTSFPSLFLSGFVHVLFSTKKKEEQCGVIAFSYLIFIPSSPCWPPLPLLFLRSGPRRKRSPSRR